MPSGRTTGFHHNEFALLYRASLVKLQNQADSIVVDVTASKAFGPWVGFWPRMWLRRSLYLLVRRQHETLLLSEALLSKEAPAEFFSIADIELKKVFRPLSSVIVASEVGGFPFWRLPVGAIRGYLALFEEVSAAFHARSSQLQAAQALEHG